MLDQEALLAIQGSDTTADVDFLTSAICHVSEIKVMKALLVRLTSGRVAARVISP